MARRKKAARARRPAKHRPERQQDARLVATLVREIDGVQQPDGTWALAVSPVEMDDGRRLLWHPPQPVAFNLIEAKKHADRGARLRRKLIGNLEGSGRGGDRSYRPRDSHATIDCIADLVAGVLFSFTAIESLANHAVQTLPDDFTLTHRKRRIRKDQIERLLGTDDKLKRVLPRAEFGRKVAGTSVWGRYRELKEMRDDLLHVKRRGYDPKPDVRTAYDRLILGDGDECAVSAQRVVEAAWPGFLPDHVLEKLAK